MNFKTAVLPNGTRLQSGIPKQIKRGNPESASGVLLRGVVTATYVVDDPYHPLAELDGAVPAAVYCDVMAYGNSPTFIPKALVCQERTGLHSGHIWKPRAASIVITGDELDFNKGADPAIVDGDHVLVGFLNGNFNQPLILKELPHPAADTGNGEKETGHRLKLVDGDGDPEFWKHHGVYFGVTTEGDYKVDTTHANDGTLDADGHEPAPPTDGKGNQYYDLPQDAEHFVRLNDVSDPNALVPVSTAQLKKALREIILGDPAAFWNLLIDGGATMKLEGKDADAKLTLGDGAKHLAIVETLQALWGSMKGTLDTWGGANGHTHPTGTGPSGPPTPALSTDPWDTSINSTKASIPDG